MRRRRRCSCRSCATRARCSSAPYAPAVLGDYVAGVNHVLPDRRHRALRRARSASTTSEAHARRARSTPGALARARARRARRSPKPKGSTRTPTRSGCAGAVVTRGTRDAPVAAARRPARARGLPLAAGRRRRAAQHQREPVRAAGRVRRRAGSTRCATSLATAIPTAPRPSCAHALGRVPRPAGRAAVLRQRHQRGAADAAAHLRRPGPARADVRADVRAARAHRARSPAPRSSPASGAADFTIDPDDGGRARSRGTRPSIVFVCSPNNPTGTVEPRETVERLLAAAADVGALLVVDEAYGEFAPWSALELVDDDRAARRRAHLLEGVVARRACGSASRSRRRGWSPSSRRCVLPYHLSVPTQLAGTIALDFGAEMERARRVAGRGARAARSPRSPTIDGIDRVPVGRQLPAVPRRTATRHALWQRLLDRGVLVRDFSSLAAASRTACASRSARPPRTTRSSPRSARSLPEVVTHDARDSRAAPRDEGDDVDRRARRRRRRHARASSTGIPFFDHMLEQLGKHGGLRPRRSTAKGDLEVDLHHTVEDVGIVLGNALREALGDKARRAPVRERARAARRGARAGRARPLGPPVPRLRRRPGRRSGSARSTRSSPRSSGRASSTARASRCTSAALSGKNGHHVIEASFKGVARALRDAVQDRRRRRAVDQGHVVDVTAA